MKVSGWYGPRETSQVSLCFNEVAHLQLLSDGRRKAKRGGKSHHQSFDAAVYKLAACVSDVNSLLF